MMFTDQTQEGGCSAVGLMCYSVPLVLKALIGLGRSYTVIEAI